jgi:iron(III) transport system substrate-binding protein
MHYAGNILPFQEKGAPVKFKILQDPPTVLPMNMGVAANAPHPNAARLFAHFRMSKEAHQIECDASPQGSPLSPKGEIDSCLELPPGWRPYNSNLPEERRNELLDALSIED